MVQLLNLSYTVLCVTNQYRNQSENYQFCNQILNLFCTAISIKKMENIKLQISKFKTRKIQ